VTGKIAVTLHANGHDHADPVAAVRAIASDMRPAPVR
jgi:hypothetical protein